MEILFTLLCGFEWVGCGVLFLVFAFCIENANMNEF